MNIKTTPRPPKNQESRGVGTGPRRRNGIVRTWAALCATLFALPLAACTAGETNTAAPAKEAEKEQVPSSEFLRIVRGDDDEPLAMETSITRYTTEDGQVEVDLIGAVHVADKEYFDQLNTIFDSYDAVLYELVAPKDARIPKPGERRKSGVSLLQGGMTEVLNLSFQLDCIDYTKPNMVHADLSPREFSESMRKRGESGLKTLFRIFGHSMAQQAQGSKTSDVEMLAALFSKNRDQKLKRLMAEQFEDMGGTIHAISGPGGSTVLTVRNERAMQVLDREIEQGAKKKLAIFYGAAHLPDMASRLTEKRSMQKAEQRWIQAWDLRPEDE